MEKKKYLPVKIVHIALMAVALMISVISMIKLLQTGKDSVYYFLVNITKILALLSGIYYIVNGYKKADASYYKTFIFFFLISEVVTCAGFMVDGTTVVVAYCELISVILMTILAIGKDLGKRNTFIYAGVTFVCKLISCGTNLTKYLTDGLNLQESSYLLSSIILALTIIFMAIGKYADKKQRGK